MDGWAEKIHEAIQDSLEEGAVLVQACIVAEVLATDGRRYLAHRATTVKENGMEPWTALGMLQASARVAEQQVLENTEDAR